MIDRDISSSRVNTCRPALKGIKRKEFISFSFLVVSILMLLVVVQFFCKLCPSRQVKLHLHDRGIRCNHSFTLSYGQFPEHSFSSEGQDRLLFTEIFLGKAAGFFIEAGALNGVSGSNTLLFEKHLGWSGICIEANPSFAVQISNVRNCTVLNKLLCSGGPYTFVSFPPSHSGYSGIWDFIPREKQLFLEQEIKEKGLEITRSVVPCTALDDLDIRDSHVDFLSLDVEGAEFEVLSKLRNLVVDVMLVEGDDKQVEHLLQEKGYILLQIIGYDKLFIRKESAPHRLLREKTHCLLI